MTLANVNTATSRIDDAIDIIAQESGEEMLSRLDFMTLQPHNMLALGRGLSLLKRDLSARYPTANSAETFAAGSQDLILANLVMPRYDNMQLFLAECLSLLRPHGLLMFTTFGLDTMREYQTLFAPHSLPLMLDMHDVGDALLKMGWEDVVVDVNYYTFTYKQQATLFKELHATQMIDVPRESLNDYVAKASSIPSVDGVWPLTYEIIHAHAFAPASMPQQVKQDGSVEVPIAAIRHGR